MIKKLVALAATALFSLNASAGYVRYDLEGTVSGFFVQHDDDKTIADYWLMVNDPNNQNVRAQFSLQAFLITSLPQAPPFPAPVPRTSISSIT